MNIVIFQKPAILKHSPCKNVGTGTQGKNKTKQRMSKNYQSLEFFSKSFLNHQANLVYSRFINIVAVVVVSRAAENSKSGGWYVALGNL